MIKDYHHKAILYTTLLNVPSPSIVSPTHFELDWLAFDGFAQSYNNYLGGLEDLQILGFDDNEPSELPDFDFGDFGANEFAGKTCLHRCVSGVRPSCRLCSYLHGFR
ncbi:hypothetical protein RJT34_20052 [Clitoria ternatea]|uniref:Uncharacterized protein n=1 Tax=Clitoria ternatea TaxID=43366 RepID=A0AAN9P4N0_CLITE